MSAAAGQHDACCGLMEDAALVQARLNHPQNLVHPRVDNRVQRVNVDRAAREADFRGQSDAFLVRYDFTDDYIWGVHWGGTENDSANGVYMTPESGSSVIYVAGYFQGAIDFDPGSGEYFDASDGLADAFLCRYDLNGVFDWERSWGGTGMDVAYDVDCMSYPAPIVTGFFSGNCYFDPGPPAVMGTSHGGTDVFFSSYTEDGEFSFARTWGGPNDDAGRACGTPYWQRYYITGDYSGSSIDMYPCEEDDLHSSLGGTDVFLSKFLWHGCW